MTDKQLEAAHGKYTRKVARVILATSLYLIAPLSTLPFPNGRVEKFKPWRENFTIPKKKGKKKLPHNEGKRGKKKGWKVQISGKRHSSLANSLGSSRCWRSRRHWHWHEVD